MTITQLTRLQTILEAIKAQTSNFNHDFNIEVETFEDEVLISFEDEFIFEDLRHNGVFGDFEFKTNKFSKPRFVMTTRLK